MKKHDKNEGFTLIELMVVITVLIVVGGVLLGTLFSTLRGVTKTNTINTVRSNGNYAITQMAKMIRDAKTLDKLNATSFTSCVVTQPVSPTPLPTLIPLSSITFSSFDGGQVTFSCDSTTISSASATLNPVSLIDTSAVSLTSCAFYCTQETILDAPRIEISFSLKQYEAPGINLGLERKASVSAIPFHTSVTMRNLGR